MARSEQRGAYTADRAAALSGVPASTVHYWSRKDILVPSVSPERVKLWSFPDLMGLRTIYWLRQSKTDPQGRDVPRTTMPAVRRALKTLRELDLDLWSKDHGLTVAVDRAGRVVIRDRDGTESEGRARNIDAGMLNLIEPFSTSEVTVGPNLQAPRPHLRIVPGKLAGSPHIVDTRIETASLAALADRGVEVPQIHRFYPVVSPGVIAEAIDLEKQLARNLQLAA